MPSEVLPQGWTTSTVEQLMLDGAVTYGVVQPGQAVECGTPMLRVNNFRGYGLDTSDVMRIASDVEAKYTRTRIRADDVLVTVVGSVGQVAIVPEELTGWNLARAVALLRPRDRKLARWIALCLRAPTAQHALGMAANTTVQTTINLKDLRKLELAMPPATERAAIQEVLSALDDRIDLLRQTNATLEAIAQALFKSWFIDFDPVRAKAEGREPEGMDAATAALFPAEFEESALGVIPKGWQVRRIEELALKVAMGPFGSNIKVATFVDEGVPVVSGQHLRGTLLEDSEFNFITEEHAQRLSGSLVRRGDIVLTHAGNIGQVALVPGDSAYQAYVLSQRQFYLRSNPEVASPEHLAYFLRSNEGQHLLLANASQVGVPSIARPASYLKSIQVVAPPVAVANAFAEVARATHLSIGSTRRRIACLEQVRDTLLPRLISGKLRLPEARAQLEEVLA